MEEAINAWTLWFDIITATDFGGTAEHLKSEIFIRKSMNFLKIENALRGQVRHQGTAEIEFLTDSFFQNGWHFPENPKIDGDTDPFLKSGKILNHHGARARICFFKK